MLVKKKIHNVCSLEFDIPLISEFTKMHKVIRVCPICKKRYEVWVKLNDINKAYLYCSKECKSKARLLKQVKVISEDEFKELYKIFGDAIKKACSICFKNGYAKDLLYEELMQECLIHFYMLSINYKLKGMSITDLSETIIIRLISKNIRFDYYKRKHYSNRRISFDSEEEDTSKLFDFFFNYTPDYDSNIDCLNILKKIIDLAKEYPNVRYVLEKAYITEGGVINANEYKCLKTKYGCETTRQADTLYRRGMEHIYYNDRENIESRFDLSNLPKYLAFNNVKYRPKIYDSWSDERILSVYTGKRNCSWCGKEFEPSPSKRNKENVYCCNECYKKAKFKRINDSYHRKKDLKKRGLL